MDESPPTSNSKNETPPKKTGKTKKREMDVMKRVIKKKLSEESKRNKIIYTTVASVCITTCILVAIIGIVAASGIGAWKASGIPARRVKQTTLDLGICSAENCKNGTCTAVNPDEPDLKTCICHVGYFGTECSLHESVIGLQYMSCIVGGCGDRAPCAPDLYQFKCYLSMGNETEKSDAFDMKQKKHLDKISDYNRHLTMTIDGFSFTSSESYSSGRHPSTMSQINETMYALMLNDMGEDHLLVKFFASTGFELSNIIYLQDLKVDPSKKKASLACKNCDLAGPLNFVEFNLMVVGRKQVKLQIDGPISFSYFETYKHDDQPRNRSYESVVHFHTSASQESTSTCKMSYGTANTTNFTEIISGFENNICIFRNGDTEMYYSSWSEWSECDVCSGSRTKYRVLREKVPGDSLGDEKVSLKEQVWGIDTYGCTQSEKACALRDSIKCPEYKCPKSEQCLRLSEICDGIYHCEHQEDEENCENGAKHICDFPNLPGINNLGRALSLLKKGIQDSFLLEVADMQSTLGSCETIQIGSNKFRKPVSLEDYRQLDVLEANIKVEQKHSIIDVVDDFFEQKGVTTETRSEVSSFEEKLASDPSYQLLNILGRGDDAFPKDVADIDHEQMKHLQTRYRIEGLAVDSRQHAIEAAHAASNRNHDCGWACPTKKFVDPKNPDGENLRLEMEEAATADNEKLNKLRQAELNANRDKYAQMKKAERQRAELALKYQKLSHDVEKFMVSARNLIEDHNAEFAAKYNDVVSRRVSSRSRKVTNSRHHEIVNQKIDSNETFIQIKVDVQVASFHMSDRLLLNGDFKKRVARLPPFVHRAYWDFFEDYGTDFVVSGTIGGKFYVLFEYHGTETINTTKIEKHIGESTSSFRSEHEFAKEGEVEKAKMTEIDNRKRTDQSSRKSETTHEDSFKKLMEQKTDLDINIQPLPTEFKSDLSTAEAMDQVISTWLEQVRKYPLITKIKKTRPICDVIEHSGLPKADLKSAACREAGGVYFMSRQAPCYCSNGRVAVESLVTAKCRCVKRPE